ncbi:MAG: SRPBCC domain-containing protein [Fimbriimonadaceae bacterium]|nr:SRPBCC domain-containing protein [Chitinophagales bacterium]
MQVYNWTKFTKRINVSEPVQSIYNVCTTQQGLEKWFLRSSVFTKPDGSLRRADEYIQKEDMYNWMWHGYPDSTNEKNKIIAANGKDIVQFYFAETCIVTIKISSFSETISIVELTEENIPDDEEHKVKYHIGCMEGWTFYLANLKSILEGGIDLRNKSLEIGGVINS